MSDRITLLTARGPILMAKRWLADGTISPYGDAKNYGLTRHEVTDIRSLSAMLKKLESKPQTCIIRGGFIGMDVARPLMQSTEGWIDGCVLRQKEVFKDRALHMMMADVDKYVPDCGMADPVAAIEEFISRKLPPCFNGVSFHWQLSNSAGHTKHAGVLKAHVWFWLRTAQTSADLKAWAIGQGKVIDTALFHPIQVHYTAAPVFDEGVTDPVAVRSGFVEGWMGDEVDLVIERADVTGTEAADELAHAVNNDPVAQRLYERGLVKGKHGREALNIICPRQEHHSTGETGPTSTMYWPAFTGGYRQGNFKCLHDGCTGVAQHKFREALGFSVLDGFEDVAGAEYETYPKAADDDDLGLAEAQAAVALDGSTSESPKSKRRVVPEAMHLCTDQANVQRLLKHFGRNLMVANDQWYAWDGRRWAKDDTMATRYSMALSKIIGQEVAEWEAKLEAAIKEHGSTTPEAAPAAPAEGKGRKTKANVHPEVATLAGVVNALRSWGTKAEMRSTIDAAISLAKRVLVVESHLLDANPWLLNCLNGTVDLRTGQLHKHSKDDFITKMCEVEYKPEAKSPTFDRVLSQVYCEEMGPAPVTRFMQRWFGYCATASTREQKFVVHYGLGSNGKSTILDVISEVLCDYAGTAAPGLLVGGASERHPTEIADLFGRRMVTAHESDEGSVLREGFIKQATGTDKIKGRFMRADFFEFDPTHKIQLLTNHKPIIKGQDYGIWRRVLMVPYKAKFGTPEEVATGQAVYVKDMTVAAKLRQEKEGVLAWIVRGAVEWFRDGLNPPDYVLAASSEYQKEQDRVLQFLDENCDIEPAQSCFLMTEMGDGIFQIYERWCKESGFFSLGKLKFLAEVERLVPGLQKTTVKVQVMSGRRKDVLKLAGVGLMS